jgi:transposase
MRVVGIDTHKATLAACAIDEIGQVLGEATFPNDPAGFDALLALIREVGPIERIGLEGSAGYGAAAARYLLAAGEAAVEVPPQLSHRERLRTRRAGKSDPGDALAIARVTSREADLPPVRTPDASRELQLIVEAREDLVAEATRVRNRLHADLVILVPGHGAAAANLVADKYRKSATKMLRRVPGVQAELARDRLARLDRLTREARELERRIEGLVADHPLRSLWGAGPLVTAKLIGEAGDISRFRSADAFAMLAGVAPIPASSGQTSRMRLNRGGNRQLNRALHGIALAQVRTYPPGTGVRRSQASRGQGLVGGAPGPQAPPRPDRLPVAQSAGRSDLGFGGLTR